MNDVKLTLNTGRIRAPSDDSAAAAVSKAAASKRAATETIDEAWSRIFATKITDKDRERLIAVRQALDEGKLGRDPADLTTKTGRPKRFSKAEALRLYAVLAVELKAETLRKMVAEMPENYRMITTEAQMGELLRLLKAEDIVAIDTETTGVDVYTDVMVGLSITLPKADIHVYIPVAHTEGEQLSREYVLGELRPFLFDENTGKVLHNAIFDIAMFRRHGFDLRGVRWDSMTAMHLLNENESEKALGGVGSFRLKDIAPKYLRVPSDTFDELFGKSARFDEIPLDIALAYAAKDTQLTWQLYEFQRSHMEKMPTMLHYYETVEVPLLYVIVEMEANGYVLDLEFARKYGSELSERAEELRKYLISELTPHHEGGDVINLNSPQQMKPALSKAIGVELANMDAKRTLKPLEDRHEIIGKLLEYRKITKLSGTYINALPEKQNPTTRRWHSRFNPIGTVTGRFSSGKDEDVSEGVFNVQNQPDEARPMFLAPPGKVLVGADFKAQEIRCVAYMSGEPVLIDAFLAERDPYAMMASNFYKRPYEDVYKNADGSDTKERKQMKVVWLATLYGMSDYSLANMLGVPKKDATAFKEELFGSMPKLSAWLRENEDFVRRHGFVWADNQARKRRLPDAKLKRKYIPYGKWNDPKYEDHRKLNGRISRAIRQTTNARVQGSSSVQTKVTMLKAHDYCRKRIDWQIWATIHDEIIFEIPEDFTREDIEIIRDLMLNSYPWGDVVPNGTDIEVMRKWGEGVPVEEWFAKTSA